MMTLERTVLDHPIRVLGQRLDKGWDISITGGAETHVGAVTLADPDGAEQTIERSGHRDSCISEAWAVRLAKEWKAPVCVRCGIHYDGVTKAQIGEIVAACEALLEAVLRQEK